MDTSSRGIFDGERLQILLDCVKVLNVHHVAPDPLFTPSIGDVPQVSWGLVNGMSGPKVQKVMIQDKHCHPLRKFWLTGWFQACSRILLLLGWLNH